MFVVQPIFLIPTIPLALEFVSYLNQTTSRPKNQLGLYIYCCMRQKTSTLTKRDMVGDNLQVNEVEKFISYVNFKQIFLKSPNSFPPKLVSSAAIFQLT